MKTTRIGVMIVEGQPAHAEAIQKALKGSGTVWDIRVARSLKEYREGAASRPPDIVLMGMDLPDGRAMDALTAPPEKAPFPILVITSHGNEKTAVQAMKSGALDYIVESPEAFAETPRKVVRALREWSLLKKAQQKDEQLRQSEERYRTITENMSDTVWVMDLDFRTTYISPSVLRTRGFTLEELQALPLDRHMTPESFKIASQALAEEMTPQKLAKKDLVISRQLELEFYRKDGTTFWGDVVMTLVRDSEGKPREIIGVGRDITEKRKFEGALKKAAEEWRATFDSITDLISIQDADYRIVRVNRAFADFFKMSPKALIGRFCYEVIHGTKHPPSFCPHKKVFETKKSIEEEIFEPRYGMYMHLVDSPIMDEKGDVVGSVHVLKNITERKRVEETLRESEERYRELFENMSSGVAVYETIEGGKDFVFTDFNKAGERIDGDRREDIIGKSIFDVRPGVKEFGLIDVFRRVWETGKPEHHPVKLYKDEKLSKWYENFVYRLPSGEIVAVYDDVTERKRAEEELQESEANLSMAQRIAGVGSWDWDLSTNRLVWSAETFRIFGRNPDDYTPNVDDALTSVHPDDRELLAQKVRTSIEHDQPYEHEYRIVDPAGDIKYLHAVGEVVRDEKGKPIHLRGAIQDITERKRAEETLRESERELKKTQQIAHLGSWRLDIETNQVVWTEELYKMYGFDPTLAPPPYTEHMKLFTPESWERLSTSLANTRETGIPYELELETVRKDGSYGWMWVRGEAIRDSKGNINGLWGAAQDITERKHTEQALRSSENLLNDVGTTAKVGGWELDVETKEVRWTKETYRIHEVSEEEKIHLSEAVLFFDEPGRSTLEAALSCGMEKGEPFDLELPFTSAKGRHLWVHAMGRAVKVDGKVVKLTGTFQDVTERKIAEDALVASETRYRRLFEAAKDGILILDADTGRIMDVNPFIKTMLGYSHEELLGKELWEIGVFKDIAANREGFLQLQDKGYIRYEDLPLQTKDGRKVSVEFVSNVYLVNHTKVVQCNIRDITQRKAAEEALRESEERFRGIAEVVPEAFFIYSLQTNRYDYLSPAFEALFGRSVAEHYKNPQLWYEAVHPDDRNRVAMAVFDSLETGFALDFRIIRPNGSIRWIFSRAFPVRDEQGNILRLIGANQDITERKAAEEALRESEERFKQVAESAGEWIWEVNADGLYTYASPIVEKILGYKPEEIVGKKYFYDFFLPEEKKAFKAVALAAFAAKLPLREFINRNVHKSGETIWLSTSGSPMLDDKGNLIGYRGADTDITDRKRAEEELKESEERYRELVENIEDIVYVTDGTGRIIFLNNAFTKISGYTREEMLRKNYMEMLTPESLRDVLVLFKKQKKGQDAGVFEMSFINKDRTVKTIEVREKHILEGGRVVEVHGLGRDVTDRKRAEEALKESEEKFRSLFRTSRDFLSISNIEGTIIEVNDASLEFFGYSSEELSRTRMHELYADSEDRQKLIHAVLESGYVQNIEIRMKKKDGEIIDALVTANLIRDNRGKPIGFFGSARDVTEKRKMEQQLLQSEKLSAVGTMISGVAHELNNPLTSIIGNAQLLAKRDVPEEIKNKLNVILKESIRSSKIVAGLLAFAREHKPERKMIDINDILMESVKLREYDVKVSNIDMRVSLSENIPKIYADPYQLQQVFINLINNARDVLVGQESAALSIRTYRKDDDVLIDFEDNGPGVPKAIAKKIFDPFFTTKEVGKGTGLGLSIAYGIVKEHDGTISVESEPAKGAKFTVTLPIREGIQPAAGTAKTAAKPPPGTRTVLVVEDEASLRDLLTEALTDDGFFVESASTGDEAISLIEGRKYDAIISDIKMPGIGGKELYLYIQKNHPEIADKIIFITGDILSKDTQSFLQITNNRFIEKPFNIDALAALLNDMLAG